jgi:hypothetical protein
LKVTNKTMIGLQPATPIPQPETPIPLTRQSGVRPRRVFLGTPVHIPPPRRLKPRPQPLSQLGAQLVAAAIVCYLIALLTAATVWL